MKITKGELKKLIEEEIDQALEEGWWEDAKRGVDKKLGTKFSHRTRSADREKASRAAIKATDQADQDERDAHDPDSLHYDPEKAQARKDRWHQSRKDHYDKIADEEAAQQSAERSRDQNRKPPEDDDDREVNPWGRKLGIPGTKSHRVSNSAGSGNMGYGESIDRDELKKAIKEELAKVLQGK
jgi:hypothetical protein